jgi:hypothetical protein
MLVSALALNIPPPGPDVALFDSNVQYKMFDKESSLLHKPPPPSLALFKVKAHPETVIEPPSLYIPPPEPASFEVKTQLNMFGLE